MIGNAPDVLVVPLSTPAGDSVMPVGSALAVVKFVVPMPSDCVNVWLNGTPTVPVFVAGAVTVMVWQVTLSVNVAVFVAPQLSVAVTVTVKEPVGLAFWIETVPSTAFPVNVPVKPGALAVKLTTEPLSEGAELGDSAVDWPAVREALEYTPSTGAVF